MNDQKTLNYKDSGVDIAAGDQLVDWLAESQPKKWPHQERIVEGIGGFAALFRSQFLDINNPCLVSSTDGVGTKVKVAAEFKKYRSVAQDLVGMCVNDILCTGAQPLFFLDYYATGKLELNNAKEFLTGLREACVEAECALLGGETAEMPGVYQNNDFDVAGFCVGVVDEKLAWGKNHVKEGDSIIAVSSSGFHSNGYSLLRKVFAKDMNDWSDELLKPTALYSKLVTRLRPLKVVHAAAHITGGGLDNVTRVIPNGLDAHLNPWTIPPGFLEVKKRTGMTWPEMLQTLNCGIGFVLIAKKGNEELIIDSLKDLPFKVWNWGTVKKQAGPAGESQWKLPFEQLGGA